ncbi:hypothetical protein N8I71_08720 [Roseibacterium sp. SDUM158016]|uniref:hypothetical protein n=1 Tax=Roseicyclus sediminis TaxID=2980997 RepID=UPI0021CF9192|nr:hypothetical protein [Roseibacterium sp. SDUM158016]MCU4652913.1 hypothetical protein [Roseibacterium sp. SDUM158016]
MDTRIVFSTDNIAGRAPDAQDAGLYGRLFGKCGLKELQRNMHDYERHRIAPWTLSFGGTDMGVGGFRLGFGQDDGMELTFAVLPEPLPVGISAEFLSAALVFAVSGLRADRVFCLSDGDAALSPRMLLQAGFSDARAAPGPGRPDLRLMRWTAATPSRA